MVDRAQEIAAKLTPGAKRALLSMSGEWQFCGKATFDANGAWMLSLKRPERPALADREIQKDGKWSRHAYRLNSLGLEVRAALGDHHG